MRIISGRFRKKTIQPPKNFRARPTTDVAKEGLFNILENRLDFESLKVLDLFSGTGSISYEFVSRGCLDVTSVELNYHHFDFINKTVHQLEIQKEMKVIKSNAFVFISHMNQQYDLIFADPPYDLKELDSIPDKIMQHQLLLPGGLLIVEHSDKTKFIDHPDFSMQKSYGHVNFSFFEEVH